MTSLDAYLMLSDQQNAVLHTDSIYGTEMQMLPDLHRHMSYA